MKRLFSNMSTWFRTAFATILAFLSGGIYNLVFAQGGDDGNAVLQQISNSMGSMVGSVITIARIGLIIGGAILLIMVIFNLFKGERDAAGKLGWWVVGLAIGIGILTILEGLVGK